MALKIRLRRMGRKNAPTYRIVVAESSMPRDGRIIASIGHYNPRTEPVTLSVDRSKALEWLGRGATPTETTKSLLKKAGVFRPEEQGVVATVAATAAKGAKQVAGAAKKAASKVADIVEDAAARVAEVVEDVAETVVEKVKGDDEPAAEAEASAGAADAQTEPTSAEAGEGAEAGAAEEPKS